MFRALSFRFEPVTFEFAWQAAFIALAVLLGVRFARLGGWGGRRAWLSGVVALPWLILLAWVLHRAWPGGWRVLFVLTAAGLVHLFSSLAYRHATRPVGRRDRRRLLALRTVALAAALLALLRPALVKRTETREKPDLFLLYDTSRSMAIRDGAGLVSRMEELIDARLANEPALDRLRRTFEVREYELSGDLAPLAALSRLPGGTATAIGPALRQVADRTERRQVAGIVLLSDGTHNAGIEPDHVVPLLRERKIPLYAVGFGQDAASGQVRDVAVKGVHSNATVFTRNLFPVGADLALLGCAGETVSLELLFDGRPVDRKEVRVAGANETRRVTLSFAPEEAGIHKLTVRSAPLPGEIVSDNNEASSYVNVLAGGLGVLYVEGKVRWEYKFLRRTLEASPDFQVTPVLILAPLAPSPSPSPSGRGDGGEGRLPPEVFNWDRYECIILGDVQPQVFTAQELEALKAAVGERGKGLMMIGGYDAFGPGGWQRTPLAEALPVRMEATDAPVTGTYQMVPGRLAERHFVLQIEEDERASRAAWDRLPPLDGASTFGELKPGAEVLAAGKDGRPLLVAQNYGQGRSMAFGADSTWRWAFAQDDTLTYHKRFWRQVVLWLTRRDKAQGTEMWLALSAQRLRVRQSETPGDLGQDLEVTAYVQDALGRPVSDCEVKAAITGPEGLRSTVSFSPQRDTYRMAYTPPAPGDFTISARALKAGSEVGSAEAKFVAYLPDLELERPLAELDRLRSLASQTGGAFFLPPQAPRLFELLDERNVPETIVVHTDIIPLWDKWWVLAVFLGALTAEWVWRKRKGMV